MKKAFTLIELIAVIVIIGVISTIGSEIFIQVYNSYYESRTQNEIENKTQLALDQISNRLAHRVKNSVIMGDPSAGTFVSVESGAAPANAIYTLEWVGVANEALRGIADTNASTYMQPGYSGFIDLSNSNGNQLSTPGSNLTYADQIMNQLSYGTLSLTTNTNSSKSAVLIYPDAQGSVQDFGWYASDANLTHPVYADTNITFRAENGADFRGSANEVYENYLLSYTAYALEYNSNTGDLRLYYNYQPWNGERYDANTTQSALLMENVTNFIFQQVGSILKVQLCVGTDTLYNAASDSYAICKEKAIF